jgi:hypothetical protein
MIDLDRFETEFALVYCIKGDAGDLFDSPPPIADVDYHEFVGNVTSRAINSGLYGAPETEGIATYLCTHAGVCAQGSYQWGCPGDDDSFVPLTTDPLLQGASNISDTLDKPIIVNRTIRWKFVEDDTKYYCIFPKDAASKNYTYAVHTLDAAESVDVPVNGGVNLAYVVNGSVDIEGTTMTEYSDVRVNSSDTINITANERSVVVSIIELV